MSKPIVVTGAAGFLGSVVARELAAAGHAVVGIDLASQAADFPGTFLGGVDLTDAAATTAAFAAPALAGGAIKPTSPATASAGDRANRRQTRRRRDMEGG